MIPPAENPTTANHDIVLTGDAIRLRALRLDDAEAIYEAVCESKAEFARWLSWYHEAYSIEDTIEFLKRRGDAFQAEGEYDFAITDRQTGHLLGATGINHLERAALRANLGYWVRTSATGRGYATQATKLVARWAFESLGLERIEIVAAVGNHKSQQVALRAGALREGIARSRLRVGETQHDAVVFSLVRGDVLKNNG